MRKYSLAEIRQRTAEPLDAWWTVLLADPIAVRIVRLAAPRGWLPPYRLTGLAGLLGVAAAGCFAGQSRGWLIGGALLFHLAFVADCAARTTARLTGTGSPFGVWCAFLAARLRVILCAVALMGRQYPRTGQARYLWLVALVVGLDLLRYLNAGQVARLRGRLPAGDTGRGGAVRLRVKSWLRARRVRSHLVSGVEFEMAVFVAGPVTGWITGTALLAGALLAAFELRLIWHLRQSARPAARATGRAVVLSHLASGRYGAATAPGSNALG